MVSHPISAALLAVGLAVATPALAGEAIELQAKGVQIYTCSAAGDGFAWHLKGPEATLTTTAGTPAGHHFAGPSWQATDGSTVVGEPVASGAGSAGSVPWLVLHAKSHSGDGVFAAVKYIVRSHTAGGAAPASGCDKAHDGGEARVDYTASYMFFPD